MGKTHVQQRSHVSLVSRLMHWNTRQKPCLTETWKMLSISYQFCPKFEKKNLPRATKDSVLSVNIIVFRKIYGKKIEGKNGYIFTLFALIMC